MSATLFLRMTDWQKIRQSFSEEEKVLINQAICGETICPQGCTLEILKLGMNLAAKLASELAAAKVAAT